MSRFMKERLKTICIIILIAAGILQVGILFGYQNQGTPISFLLGIFKGAVPQVSDAVTREKLFIPDKLILSDGNNSHWVLNKNNKFYDGLWDEVKQGLQKIASGAVELRASNEQWGDLAEKRGIMVDFGYKIKPDLLAWFLGVNQGDRYLPDVYKVIMKPDIIYKSTSAVLYIYSMDGKVYVSDSINYEKVTDLESVISEVLGNEKQEYREYFTLRGSKIDKAGDEPDVLYVSLPPEYWPYYEYNIQPPAAAEEKDKLAAIVLGTEKERYNKSSDNSAVQFNYGSNIYKYYNDGYLTYRYLGGADSLAKGETGAALLNAYKFVVRISELCETTPDIMLTSVEEIRQGVYSFGFDYRLEGMPVKVEIKKKDGRDGKLTSAISIQADSRRVLRCDWLLRDFIKGEAGNYNDRLIDVLGNTGMTFKEIQLWDVNTGYFIDSTVDGILRPVLLVELKDKPVFPVEMPLKKGG